MYQQLLVSWEPVGMDAGCQWGQDVYWRITPEAQPPKGFVDEEKWTPSHHVGAGRRTLLRPPVRGDPSEIGGNTNHIEDHPSLSVPLSSLSVPVSS